jgi:hypothetical protein
MDFAAFMGAISQAISGVCRPILVPAFRPFNSAMAALPQWLALPFALGLFVGAMIWVWAFLKKDFVNLDAPHKGILYDLRWWTILSMLPHIAVYLYFR